MKWLVIGGVVVGAGLLFFSLTSSPSVPRGATYPAFGMPLYGGADGSGGAGAYGMAYYGGYQASSGWWKPNMLEGK